MRTIHPSMPPGAIIGYRKNGLPIRMIAGGSGEGDDGGEGCTGQEGGAGTGGRDSGGSGSGSNGTGSDTGDPEHTQKVITAIRGDMKTERERRQAAECELADVKAARPRCSRRSTPTRVNVKSRWTPWSRRSASSRTRSHPHRRSWPRNWRRSSVQLTPRKSAPPLRTAVALGGDCLADIAVLRRSHGTPRLFGGSVNYLSCPA
jgi:hypothetical protein